ncbi:hypothetical protein V6N13_072484 [Hibiscus sabdariffa]
MIQFIVQDNQWTVNHFISEHNHELTTTSKRHLLRSTRSIPTAIDSMMRLLLLLCGCSSLSCNRCEIKHRRLS